MAPRPPKQAQSALLSIRQNEMPNLSLEHIDEIADLSSLYLSHAGEAIEFSEQDIISNLHALVALAKKQKAMRAQHAKRVKQIAAEIILNNKTDKKTPSQGKERVATYVRNTESLRARHTPRTKTEDLILKKEDKRELHSHEQKKKLFLIDSCYVIGAIAAATNNKGIYAPPRGIDRSKGYLEAIFSDLKKESNGGEIVMPRQVYEELREQCKSGRTHDKRNKFRLPENALLVPKQALDEIEKLIYSGSKLITIEGDPVSSDLLAELRNKLKQGSGRKENSRVGLGEAGIYSFLNDFAGLYLDDGFKIEVKSVDSDVAILIKSLPFKVEVSA